MRQEQVEDKVNQLPVQIQHTAYAQRSARCYLLPRNLSGTGFLDSLFQLELLLPVHVPQKFGGMAATLLVYAAPVDTSQRGVHLSCKRYEWWSVEGGGVRESGMWVQKPMARRECAPAAIERISEMEHGGAVWILSGRDLTFGVCFSE